MSILKISRRKFLIGAGAGGAALAGYSAFCEPQWLELGRHEIDTGAPRNPLKLLHLSDLHASWYVSLSYIGEALERGLQWKPDLICVTGDFITKRFDDLDGYCRILSCLPAAAPTFATLGNHDGGYWARRHGGYDTTEWVCRLLQKSGIELLHNRSTDLQLKGRPVRLVGVGDWYVRDVQPQRAFPKTAPAPASCTVLLSHNPDSKEVLLPYPWDLMLCGHTHGGQCRLPIIGAPFAPVVDKRFVAGLYCWENRRLHITKGVGNVFGVRFNCRPEISLLTLA